MTNLLVPNPEMGSLAGKKILLIAPLFFRYEVMIQDALKSLGASVFYIPDRPFLNPVLRALTNRLPTIASFVAEYFYYRKYLKSFSGVDLDYVFVVNGQTCSNHFISYLRLKYKTARYLLYFWDSVLNRPSSICLSHKFDRVLTFDPADSTKHGWIFRPLFFAPQFTLPDNETNFKYGLSFIATAHSDRFSISRKIFRQVENKFKVFKYLYLQASWVYYIYKIVNPEMSEAKISDFHFKPLDSATVRSVFEESSCILDIEHPLQSGLTIRIFESIGARKKLITTNQSIAEYDFFSEKNIHIVDRIDPQVPLHFLNDPYIPLPDDIYRKYSIYGWIADIFHGGAK